MWKLPPWCYPARHKMLHMNAPSLHITQHAITWRQIIHEQLAHWRKVVQWAGQNYNPGQKYMVHLENLLCFHYRPLFDDKGGSFPQTWPSPLPSPYNVASRGILWAHWPNIVRGGGGKEWWNCQKRPSVPLLLTRIVDQSEISQKVQFIDSTTVECDLITLIDIRYLAVGHQNRQQLPERKKIDKFTKHSIDTL